MCTHATRPAHGRSLATGNWQLAGSCLVIVSSIPTTVALFLPLHQSLAAITRLRAGRAGEGDVAIPTGANKILRLSGERGNVPSADHRPYVCTVRRTTDDSTLKQPKSALSWPTICPKSLGLDTPPQSHVSVHSALALPLPCGQPSSRPDNNPMTDDASTQTSPSTLASPPYTCFK